MTQIHSNTVAWFLGALYRNVVIYVPCVLLALIVFDYCIKIVSDTYTTETFDRVIDGIKVSATMAALGFYAGYMTTDMGKKPRFYKHGENMFHATVLLFISGMLQTFLIEHRDGRFDLPVPVIGPMLLVIKSCLLVFITYAVFCLMVGITGLLRALHSPEDETPSAPS